MLYAICMLSCFVGTVESYKTAYIYIDLLEYAKCHGINEISTPLAYSLKKSLHNMWFPKP